MSKKSWREQLMEMGGYENSFIGIQAGVVREIIGELEECHERNDRLSVQIVNLQQAVRQYVREAKEARGL